MDASSGQSARKLWDIHFEVPSARGPFESSSSVCYGPLGLVDARPIGVQSQVFCGLIPPVQVLKVGVPDVGFKPFTPQGEAPGL